MQLQFDPFSFAPASAPNPNPNQAASIPNGAPFMSMGPFQTNFAAQHAFFGSDATSMVPPPPLTVSNTSGSLPDFPDGADTLNVSQASAIPPPHAHLAFIGRPRPRPGSTSSQQVSGEVGSLATPFSAPSSPPPPPTTWKAKALVNYSPLSLMQNALLHRMNLKQPCCSSYGM